MSCHACPVLALQSAATTATPTDPEGSPADHDIEPDTESGSGPAERGPLVTGTTGDSPPAPPGPVFDPAVRCLGCAPGIVVKTHQCAGDQELLRPDGDHRCSGDSTWCRECRHRHRRHRHRRDPADLVNVFLLGVVWWSAPARGVDEGGAGQDGQDGSTGGGHVGASDG